MNPWLAIPLVLLAACAQFPQVDAAFGPKDPAAPPARLIPLGDGISADFAAPDLGSRAARLRKRAAALRQ